jgi:hypothetical protein
MSCAAVPAVSVAGSVVRRRCGDAPGREAPAGAGEAEQIAGVSEGGGDDEGSLVGRGDE